MGVSHVRHVLMYATEGLEWVLSGGTTNERHKSRDESQRTVGLPRGSCTLADPMGGSLSLRSQLENQRGGAPPCFSSTRKLSHAWVEFSHAEWNPHNTQRRFTTQGSPCIEIT